MKKLLTVLAALLLPFFASGAELSVIPANADLAKIISNAAPGQLILLGPYSYTLTNSVTIPVGVTIEGKGPSTVITNACSRPSSDPQNGTIAGAMLTPSDNVSIKSLRVYGLPTINASQNVPCIGTIYFDRNQPSFTNVLVQDVITTNANTGIYIRHTNNCQITIRDCDLYAIGGGLLSIGPGPGVTILDAWNSRFIGIGPNLITNDSGQFQARGASIFNGSNTFTGCKFIGRNSTVPTPLVATTNTCGLDVENNFNLASPTVVNAYACTYDASDTNPSNTCVWIYAPPVTTDNQGTCWQCQAAVTNHGSYFTNYAGQVVFDVGTSVVGTINALNPNVLIITNNNTGSGISGGLIFTNNASTWTDNQGLGDTITGSANNWVMNDAANFFTPAYKNTTGAQPWQGAWVANGAALPAPLTIEGYSLSNLVQTFTGNGASLTNIPNTALQNPQSFLTNAPGVAGKGMTNLAGVLSVTGDGSSLVNLSGTALQAGSVPNTALQNSFGYVTNGNPSVTNTFTLHTSNTLNSFVITNDTTHVAFIRDTNGVLSIVSNGVTSFQVAFTNGQLVTIASNGVVAQIIGPGGNVTNVQNLIASNLLQTVYMAYSSSGTAPTATTNAGPALGATGTVTLLAGSTDSRGVLIMTPGTAVISLSTGAVSVAFGKTAPATPFAVKLSTYDGNAAATGKFIQWWPTNISTTGFQVWQGTNSVALGSNYRVYYEVVY